VAEAAILPEAGVRVQGLERRDNNMTNRNKREVEMMKRVKQFVADHALVPPNAAATAEAAAIATAIDDVEGQAENQEAGSGTVSGAVDQRLLVVDELLNLMSSLSKAAKTLDTATYPDVATKMRMGGITSFAGLMTRAMLFHSTLLPIEAVFVALGAEPTVAADLQAMIDELQSAGNLKFTGLDTQVGGTFGLSVKTREGLKHVAKLDAILCQVYRKNPVLLAQWKTVRRVERDPVTEPAPAPAAPPTEGGEGSGS
jgi:hypothetical protein